MYRCLRFYIDLITTVLHCSTRTQLASLNSITMEAVIVLYHIPQNHLTADDIRAMARITTRILKYCQVRSKIPQQQQRITIWQESEHCCQHIDRWINNMVRSVSQDFINEFALFTRDLFAYFSYSRGPEFHSWTTDRPS